MVVLPLLEILVDEILAIGEELLHLLDRRCESDVLDIDALRAHHADDSAIGVQQRPAAVAWIDGRGGLDVLVTADLAIEAAHNASGDGLIEDLIAESRIADGDDAVAQAVGGIGDGQGPERHWRPLDLERREVIRDVDRLDPASVGLGMAGDALHLGGADGEAAASADDVIVGDHDLALEGDPSRAAAAAVVYHRDHAGRDQGDDVGRLRRSAVFRKRGAARFAGGIGPIHLPLEAAPSGAPRACIVLLVTQLLDLGVELLALVIRFALRLPRIAGDLLFEQLLLVLQELQILLVAQLLDLGIERQALAIRRGLRRLRIHITRIRSSAVVRLLIELRHARRLRLRGQGWRRRRDRGRCGLRGRPIRGDWRVAWRGRAGAVPVRWRGGPTRTCQCQCRCRSPHTRRQRHRSTVPWARQP